MDPITADGCVFAIVHDVAGSWHDYRRLRALSDQDAASGLLVHAAGPTHDGFRTVDLWGTEALWQAQQRQFDLAVSPLAVAPIARQFHVRHLVVCMPGGERFTSTQETQP